MSELKPTRSTERDGEPEFRLRPRPPKVSRSETQALGGFRRVMQLFVSSAKKAMRPARSHTAAARAPRFNASQRCAVRVSYSSSKTKGQWRAHGRYLERDSAIGENKAFDKAESGVNLQERLAEWQSAKDRRLFKLILSPEYGDRLDLPQLARDFMERTEARVGASLEWVAVVHNNTEHPHIHIALRGAVSGAPLRLDKELIRNGMREEAERLCTLSLGYRTEQDVLEAQRQEVAFARPTSLDRQIQKRAVPGDGAHLQVTLPTSDREFFQLLASRMAALGRMGLAQPHESRWHLRSDYLQVLKSMQQAGDRQKMLHQYGVLLSDPRLHTQVTRARDIEHLEGRVLAHVQDDLTGAPQMLLEGTDGRVHFIRHTPQMELMRQEAKLKPNSFVSIERTGEDGQAVFLKIADHGDAEAFLSSDQMRRSAKRLIQRGIIPTETEYSGWLGRYHRTLANNSHQPEPNRHAQAGSGKESRGR